MLRAHPFVRSLIALAVGFILSLLLCLALGEDPSLVAKVLFSSSFESWYDFGVVLFYATPLLFTGLSVAVAFRGGLFNIGAEGQLTMGALAAALVGLILPELPYPSSILMSVLAAMVVGGLWGAVPGALKAYRGTHEVISTIMMNFIAAGLSTYIALTFFPNPDSQNPETAVLPDAFVLQRYALFDDAPVSFALPLALMTAGLIYFLFRKTIFGFKIEAIGQNLDASRTAGISTRLTQVWIMTLAGALAGLVALPEVLGNSERFRVGFSPGFGFLGIAVALLSRAHPIGIIFSAFLFAVLHKGTADLEFETDKISRDISSVIQSLIILSVSAEGLWNLLFASPKGTEDNEK